MVLHAADHGGSSCAGSAGTGPGRRTDPAKTESGRPGTSRAIELFGSRAGYRAGALSALRWRLQLLLRPGRYIHGRLPTAAQLRQDGTAATGGTASRRQKAAASAGCRSVGLRTKAPTPWPVLTI